MRVSEPAPLGNTLFDDYLEALLRDRACDPVTFLNGRDVSASIRAELDTLHQALQGYRDVADRDGCPYKTLGEFRLLHRIGAGGMGVVFVAEQQPLDRIVALKILRADLACSDSAGTRFEREARCVARLRHPHIVSVYTVGKDRGIHYIAMELVPGRGLDEYLSESLRQGQPLAASTVLMWIAQIADALECAHQQGVLHRDIKPSNIRITPEGKAKLLDFGLARDLHSQSMTLTETLAGSPLYVAPEQVGSRGGSVDARTDVYGLGITMYECLTGRVPFKGDQLEQLLHAILSDTPAPPRTLNPNLTPEVEAVVLKAIDRNPARRYGSVREFGRDIEALMAFRPTSVRPPGMLRRLMALARRKPALAWAAATLPICIVILVLLGPALLVRLERRQLAHGLIAESRARITGYEQLSKSTRDLEQELDRLDKLQQSSYLSPDDEALLYAKQDRLRELLEERSRVKHATLDLLRQAEDLGGDGTAIKQLRAELYYIRYLEARNTNQYAQVGLFRDLVLANDQEGRLAARIISGSKLFVDSLPPAADVYLFKIRNMNQVHAATDQRLVPVPVKPCSVMVNSGSWCLLLETPHAAMPAGLLIRAVDNRRVRDHVVVAEHAEPVHPGDRLLSIDGHAVRREDDVNLWDGVDSPRRYAFERDGRTFEVTGLGLADLGITVCGLEAFAARGDVDIEYWDDGQLSVRRLPPGARLRTTSLPLLTCPDTCVGRTPVTGVDIEEGHFLILLRAPGYEDFKLVLETSGYGSTRLPPIRMNRAGTTPEGYCHIPYDYITPGAPPCWIKRHEVTVGEYLEFLNSPDTQATLARAAAPMLFPRSRDNDQDGGYWPRLPDGRFELVDGWSDTQPMRAISYEDATAYAAWLTRRARRNDLPHTYHLPTLDQWLAASGTGAMSKWVYGSHFRPKWQSACFSTPTPHVEPVMSYPNDESMYGVYDMAGSVSEWLDDWWLPGQRRHAGGSWANGGDGDMFSLWGGNGLPPDATSQMVGFRLVLLIEEGHVEQSTASTRP